MNGTKIKDHPNLLRVGSGIINTDDEAYQNALKRRQKQKEIDKTVEAVKEVKERIASMESDISKILELLRGKQ